VDVLIGCGWGEQKDDDRDKQGDNFLPGNRFLAEIDMEKIDHLTGGKYVIAQRTRGRNGLEALNEGVRQAVQNNARLLGFFGHSGGHLPYQTADGDYNPTRGEQYADRYSPDELAENPTLEQMTEAALSVLGRDGQKFWLTIEAGDVDWANHNNNIDDSIGAVFSGEAAFEAVTRWIEKHSNWNDSAVIVTADHGHLLVIDDLQALTGQVREVALEAEVATEKKHP
jgi:alkaline phosphatase